MFSCCVFCCSLFCIFLLCTCFLYFYFCAASYGVIKNEYATQSYKRLLLCLNSSRNKGRRQCTQPQTISIYRRRLDILLRNVQRFFSSFSNIFMLLRIPFCHIASHSGQSYTKKSTEFAKLVYQRVPYANNHSGRY